MTKPSLQLKRTVLLNIDMQHFFVEGAPDGLKVMQRINRLSTSCRKANILVIHTTHAFEPDVPDVEEAIALSQGIKGKPK